MKIPYINLKSQWINEREKLLPILEKAFLDSQYINGDEVSKFEKNIAKFCGSKFALALNSGTDALTIGLYMLGVRKGDEVITPPNSFIASTSAIVHLGAKPVFADVLPDQNINPEEIKKKITKKTKAIMPVHLTGRVCDMKAIMKLSSKYKIPVIEDAAQAVGSSYYGKRSGTFGHVGCFSAHPLKNLNACGDGGFLVTNNYKIYSQAKLLINHGLKNRNLSKDFGYVSRMDTIQAAILNFRLRGLKNVIKKRRANAQYYISNLNRNFYKIPKEEKNQYNSYHTFVVQTEKRNKLIKFLKKFGIGVAVHYPIPIHLQEASRKFSYKKGDFPITEYQAKEILSLPIHQNLSKKELNYIVKKLNFFAENNL